MAVGRITMKPLPLKRLTTLLIINEASPILIWKDDFHLPYFETNAFFVCAILTIALTLVFAELTY